MIVLGIIGGVVMLALLVGLYVWTRRSERDIEIPLRELTDQEKTARLIERGAAANIIGGMGGGGGGV
ncbi:hypothetical protein ACXR2U_02365 [Jatrophihabitans sp. YIM 134969]